MAKTNITATAQQLHELLSMDEDDELKDVIQVCDGEWRKEPRTDLDFQHPEYWWRFWQNPERADA